MSRIAKKPIELPKGVEIDISGQMIGVRGPKGSSKFFLNNVVKIEKIENEYVLSPITEIKEHISMTGTMRALLNNVVTGVYVGYKRKLELIGVGYRAQAKGDILSLTLGFSHPVEFKIPEGITIETPTQTEIIVSGIDKQQVGQVSANIRAYRPPEPYKGKGVRYSDEIVLRKETKKK